MSHSFENKILTFIGKANNCTRNEARDELIKVGGIYEENVSTFTDYVVAFPTADKTKKYITALRYAKRELLVIINENQFFDILVGNAEAPKPPKPDESIVIIPADNLEALNHETEQSQQVILKRKRLNNLANYGVPIENGRMKIDLRPLDKAKHVADLLSKQE